MVNNSLVCRANKETHGAVKHQSEEQAPAPEPIPEGKGCSWWLVGGRGGSPFVPPATSRNIHAAGIPQRKRNLIHDVEPAAIEEQGFFFSLFPFFPIRSPPTRPVQAHGEVWGWRLPYIL